MCVYFFFYVSRAACKRNQYQIWSRFFRRLVGSVTYLILKKTFRLQEARNFWNWRWCEVWWLVALTMDRNELLGPGINARTEFLEWWSMTMMMRAKARVSWWMNWICCDEIKNNWWLPKIRFSSAPFFVLLTWYAGVTDGVLLSPQYLEYVWWGTYESMQSAVMMIMMMMMVFSWRRMVRWTKVWEYLWSKRNC